MSGSIAYWSCTTHMGGIAITDQAFLSAHELMTLEGGDS